MALPLATRSVEYRLFEALGEVCGVVVVDPEAGQLRFRFRRDWQSFAGEEAETLPALCADLQRWSREGGSQEESPAAFLKRMDEALSNVLRISDKMETLAGSDLDATLNRLYNRHVKSKEQATTHLPLWSVKLAAGGWSQPHAALEEGRIEAPENLRIAEGMFVARVLGRSMEPDIPDGSLCVFRRIGAGSRAGKIVVVEHLSSSDDAAEYTIKRYESTKKHRADGTWEHEAITMQPVNPEYDRWQLETEEDASRIVAEFVSILESPEPPH
jgi:SOS-response transcriptional repressor LexA